MTSETASTMPADEPAPERKRPLWRRRWVARVSIALLLSLIAGEVFARFYLGLGDPPLLRADAQIEYLFMPDQDCRRFGNHIRYNHYSMRSDDFPLRKSSRDEFRVLVVGDSVVNGGVLTDQSQTVTSYLQQRLAEDLKRPVVVGNISAGSWGPPNMLAYLKRFGLFEADVVVIVLSSHDYADAPTFEPVVGVDPASPSRKPVLALWEGFERYVLPKFRQRPASNEGFVAPTAPPAQADIDACTAALREMIAMARQGGARVIVAQHLEASETLASPMTGHGVIGDEVRRAGLAPVELGAARDEARRRGEVVYRDHIHPNPAGNRAIALTLASSIEAAPGDGTVPFPPASGPATAPR